MKGSQFNVITDYAPTGETLLFNTASGALVSFPRSESATVHAVLDGDTHSQHTEVAALLRQHGFAIEAAHDEVAEVLGRVQTGIEDQNRLDVFLLPNMNCNFACPYCYEDHRHSQMGEAVEAGILQWFAHEIPRTKALLVSWFGGEPMLSYECMHRIQRQVQIMAGEAGITFNAHITTNGYLLSPTRAAALCDSGILSYQITMDGPPDIHNERRLLRGPGDSFDRVFDNLCSLANDQPRAHIKLRVNFDMDTLARVPELLEMVPSHLRPRMNLVLERIFGQGAIFIGLGRDHVARATEAMYNTGRELGFEVTAAPLGPTQLTYCYADRQRQILFTHTGDVFKCTVSKFQPEERLGKLEEDGSIAWEPGRLPAWMAVPAVDEECRACTYLPMCMGGCRKTRFEKGHASADCTLPFAAMDLRVRQMYATTLVDETSKG